MAEREGAVYASLYTNRLWGILPMRTCVIRKPNRCKKLKRLSPFRLARVLAPSGFLETIPVRTQYCPARVMRSLENVRV
jgi:hypothetical protein